MKSVWEVRLGYVRFFMVLNGDTLGVLCKQFSDKIRGVQVRC
jgi:hypothetical protein